MWFLPTRPFHCQLAGSLFLGIWIGNFSARNTESSQSVFWRRQCIREVSPSARGAEGRRWIVPSSFLNRRLPYSPKYPSVVPPTFLFAKLKCAPFIVSTNLIPCRLPGNRFVQLKPLNAAQIRRPVRRLRPCIVRSNPWETKRKKISSSSHRRRRERRISPRRIRRTKADRTRANRILQKRIHSRAMIPVSAIVKKVQNRPKSGVPPSVLMR
jgi:hypothetical protein